MSARLLRLVALLAVLAMVVAACGGDDSEDPAEETEASTEETDPPAEETEAPAEDTEAPDETEPMEEETEAPEEGGTEGGIEGGTITISGSSTVEPVSALVAQAFDGANGTATTVEGPGTGDGFARFCAGETDISDASRAIAEDEIAACEEAGIEYVELRIAIDGMAVLTAPANEAVSCLAFTDLYALLGPESEGFQNWSDANDLAAELSAPNAPYSDAPLTITAPGEESGTYDSFVEIVIEALAEERVGEDSIFTRADYSPEANDNVIINNLAGNDTSLGWVGYAFYVENTDVVKALDVDSGESGCVTPTEETIADGSYPLARPLFIYAKTTDMTEQTQAFVDYYLSDEGLAAVGEAGYVSLPEDQIAETRAAWEEATAG